MAERLGVLRLRDARAEGIHPEVLRRLARQGQLVKIARGIYAPASADLSTHHDLALASARVPHGTICMLSALSYHEIGTQLPHEVWMMIDRRSRKPRIDRPAMRFVLASGPALALGIDRGAGGMRLWALFGTTNQLTAGLSLLIVTLFLMRLRRPIWVTMVPMIFILFMTTWAMVEHLMRYWTDSEPLLIAVGAAIFVLEIWLIFEAVLAFRRAMEERNQTAAKQAA